MAFSSPLEFLTLYRCATRSQALRYRPATKLPQRHFAVSSACRADTGNPHAVSTKGTQQATAPGQDTGPSRQHAVDKGSEKDPNVQSYETNAARSSRAQDTGGQAIRQQDERNSTAKAKKDHPEAPDVVIGMQDERGGKGL